MKRDGLAQLVDITTVVVGFVAIAALVFNWWTLRQQRRLNEEQWARQLAVNEEQWRRQLTLDHHSRVYSAAADSMSATTAFTRLSDRRVQARRTLRVDRALPEDYSEVDDPVYAEQLDREAGATLAEVQRAQDDALVALNRLWFLIPAAGAGEHLLKVIGLVEEALRATRPTVGHDSGTTDLRALIRDSGLEAEIDDSIPLPFDDDPDANDDPTRLRMVRDLGNIYLRFRVGLLVEPPPLADLTA